MFDKIAMILGYFLMIIFIFNIFFNPTDNSDKGFWKRSGLTIYTDHLTGVQYVKGGLFGDITPRINHDGTPIINRD